MRQRSPAGPAGSVSNGSSCFRFPRRVPKRGNQPVVSTDIRWLSVDRLCSGGNSTADVAKQKACEREVG